MSEVNSSILSKDISSISPICDSNPCAWLQLNNAKLEVRKGDSHPVTNKANWVGPNYLKRRYTYENQKKQKFRFEQSHCREFG